MEPKGKCSYTFFEVLLYNEKKTFCSLKNTLHLYFNPAAPLVALYKYFY